MIQAQLSSNGITLVTWLDESKPIKPGDRITLKNHPEPTRLWEVLEVYGSNQGTINRGWHVGGM